MSESHVNPSAHVLFFDALSKRASVIPAPDDQPLSLDLLAEHCLFTIKSALASIDSMQLEASIYAFILKTPLTRPPKALVAIDLLSWAASKIAETILSSSDRESVTVYADAVNETISLSRNGTLSEIDYFVQVGYKYALHIEPDDPFTLPDHLRCVRRDTAQSWKHTDYRNHGTVLSWSHPPIDIMLQLHRFLQHQNWASFLELSSVNKVWKGLAEPLRWQQITVSSDENLKEILNSVPASTLSLVQRINIKDKAQTKQLLTLLSRCSRLNAIMLESNGMMAGMTQLRLALRPPFQQLIVDDTFMDLIEKSFVGFCDLGLDLVNKTDAHYPQFVDDIYPGFADDDDFSAEEVGKPTREEMQRVLNEKFAHISRLQVLKSGQRDQKELQNFAITVYKALPQLETIEGLIWSFYTDPRTTSIASVSDLNLFLDFVSLPWITLTTLKFDILFYPGYERDRSIFLYPDHFQGANERISFLLRQKAGCLPTVKTIDFYLNCARGDNYLLWISSFLALFPNLENLTLYVNWIFGNDVIDVISNICPKLQSLRFSAHFLSGFPEGAGEYHVGVETEDDEEENLEGSKSEEAEEDEEENSKWSEASEIEKDKDLVRVKGDASIQGPIAVDAGPQHPEYPALYFWNLANLNSLSLDISDRVFRATLGQEHTFTTQPAFWSQIRRFHLKNHLVDGYDNKVEYEELIPLFKALTHVEELEIDAIVRSGGTSDHNGHHPRLFTMLKSCRSKNLRLLNVDNDTISWPKTTATLEAVAEFLEVDLLSSDIISTPYGGGWTWPHLEVLQMSWAEGWAQDNDLDFERSFTALKRKAARRGVSFSLSFRQSWFGKLSKV